MVIAYPTSDGFMPPPNSPVRDTADATAVIRKFKNLKLGDRSTSAEGGDVPGQMVITRQFERLDISGGSPGQMDNNSAQTTAAGRSRTSFRTKPIHTNFDLPIQCPAQPLYSLSELIDNFEDVFSVQDFEDDDLNGRYISLAMRSAKHKKAKKRTRTASKRLSKGPIRKKIGGVGRHRHNASHKRLPR